VAQLQRMTHQKASLPTKVCKTCCLEFTWRKKWKRDWGKVEYCSERCRRNKPDTGRKKD
jgi:hypothetical protein